MFNLFLQITFVYLGSITDNSRFEDSEVEEGTKNFIYAFHYCIKDLKFGYVYEKGIEIIRDFKRQREIWKLCISRLFFRPKTALSKFTHSF